MINMEFSNNNLNERKDKSLGHYFPYVLLLMIIVFFCVFGITYSIYKPDNSSDNGLTTDKIIFTYSDVDKVGNGIYLNNATPITDDLGKMLIGNRQYFDFYVNATTKKSKLRYFLLINKDDTSTLADSNVKVYLVKLSGDYEEELVLTEYSKLPVKMVNGKKYYVLYTKDIDNNSDNYGDSYRLRMWIKNDATDYSEKRFSIKVDVYAEQVEE